MKSVIEMAREAGAYQYEEGTKEAPIQTFVFYIDELERFAALVREDILKEYGEVFSNNKSKPEFINGEIRFVNGIYTPLELQLAVDLYEANKINKMENDMDIERECCGTFKGSPHRKTCYKFKGYTQADIEATVLKAVLEEREACAKVCEERISYWGRDSDRADEADQCAAAIRSRSSKH